MSTREFTIRSFTIVSQKEEGVSEESEEVVSVQTLDLKFKEQKRDVCQACQIL